MAYDAFIPGRTDCVVEKWPIGLLSLRYIKGQRCNHGISRAHISEDRSPDLNQDSIFQAKISRRGTYSGALGTIEAIPENSLIVLPKERAYDLGSGGFERANCRLGRPNVINIAMVNIERNPAMLFGFCLADSFLCLQPGREE
jgi:hypothetical protein